MQKTILLGRVLAALTAFAFFSGFGRLSAAEETPQGKQDQSLLNAKPEDIARWRQLKFGMFIHWGPVSLQGTEIGWSRGGERRGLRGGGTGEVPLEVYDNLYKQFNPVKFDAREWVEIAKTSGMKYMVFTTRHHDGFSMFDSQFSDYKITNPESPYRKDIVKQLADACHAGDLIWGIYYSQPDWHHPDYMTANHAKYVEYLHGQVKELLSNYGRTEMLFFDGLGGDAKRWDAENLFKIIRALQPRIIVNNRCGLPADNDTPEQRIGKMQTGRPWETCMTIGDQWAWKPHDNVKSLKTCLQTLVKVVCGDGNLLFNVGPMPDGRIEPRQIETLKQMGAWLEKYGETIYNTRGGPFPRTEWGGATMNGKTVYVHILDPGVETVVLPPISAKIVSSSVLTGGTATITQSGDAINISVPKADRNEIDTIVALELDTPAAEAKALRANTQSVATGKKAAASNVFRKMVEVHGPQNAFDDDHETRWATDGGTHQAWLEVDLGEPKTIASALIAEADFGPRVRKFELQAKVDGQWKTVFTGKTLGEECRVKFEPVAAQVFRLNVLEATEGPTIEEFQLFEAK
ncbi:MAG: alpha-L-fucosidase [Pirellulales bacterium]|nr:alpha-L-fucosidase [Pirellulales bacterium]